MLGIGLEHAFGCVVETEVGSSVDDDTLYRDAETPVEAEKSVRLEYLSAAVDEAVEFSLARSFADIGGEPGPSKVQRVYEAEGCGTGCATRG